MKQSMGWIAASVCLMAAAPVFAHGNQRSTSQSSTSGTSANPSESRNEPTNAPGSIQVSQRFTRGFADGCEYRGELSGNLERVTTGGTATYNPRLSLDGRVHCADGYDRAIERQSIQGSGMTWSQLEHELEQKGRITIDRGGRTCIVHPDFALRQGQVVVHDTLSDSCRMERGGGPGTNLNRGSSQSGANVPEGSSQSGTNVPEGSSHTNMNRGSSQSTPQGY